MFELENSQPITLAAVPQHVIDAFLAVEDKEFYRHDGVNVRSLVRATLSNFASDSPQQGASTITMQVVKNDFLAGLERDGRYKLLQVHYALLLEREHTKDEILERYLNTVFFGNNAYGIQAAAETYFGKTADQLTFIEAAFLAGLVRAPTAYDPVSSPERSRARFTQVLDRLVDDGSLTAAEAADLEANFPLPDRVRTIPERTNIRTYYTEALRDYLLNRSDILGTTYEERYNKLFRGGLRIHTTYNPINQSQAEQARNVLPDTAQGFDAALVSLDTPTGAIRAMVGGRGFVPGENEVNMALSPRQTGSSIKFFVLAAALQAGAQPDDIIDGQNVCTFAVPDAEPFVIKDAVSRAPGHAGPDDVALDQLRLRPPGPDRRPQPDGRHGRTGCPSRCTCTRGSRRATVRPAPRASSRSSASRPAPTRCRRWTWRRAPRRSPTAGCTTSRTTSSGSTPPTGSASTPTPTPAPRSSTGPSPWRRPTR